MTPIDKARNLFTEIAARYSLTIEWDGDSPVEVACWLRKQRGLDWDLWLNLQNVDELGVQHELFTAEWFPVAANGFNPEAEFAGAVSGLISGDIRLKCSSAKGAERPFRVDLERISTGEWRSIFSYRRDFRGRRAVSVQIIKNGHEMEIF
jgi:hypothetical protein